MSRRPSFASQWCQLSYAGHFVATLMLVGGQDVRTVSGRLGHANAATTLGIYAHFMEAADHKAADLMAGLLDGGGTGASPSQGR